MYAITAQINRTGVKKTKGFPEGWESSRQVPTFYLDERVQGIMSEAHAVDIARAILLPWGSPEDMTAAITAVRVSGEDNAPQSVDPTVVGSAPHVYLYQTGDRPDGLGYAVASSVAQGRPSSDLALFADRDDAHVAAVALCAARGPEWEVHVLPSAATPMPDMVEHVKMFAVDHYGETGWATIVDAWADEDIEAVLLRKFAFTKAAALAAFVDVVSAF